MRIGRCWRMAVGAAAACCGTWAWPTQAQQTLQPISQEEADDLALRVPGCLARLEDATTGKPLAAVAQASWVMLRSSNRTVQAPIVFRDRSTQGPEVRFSVTDADMGGSLRAALTQTGKARQCTSSTGCGEFPARLAVTFVDRSGVTSSVFDGPVKVIDPCAAHAQRRLFLEVGRWERAFRAVAGH